MKRRLLIVAFVFVVTGSTFAQSTRANASVKGRTETSAAVASGKELAAGTRLTGELQSNLDARKAKVGDQVVLKTTQAIKSEGHVVVNKGARLVGHVTSVAQKTRANSESQIGILFDRLETGSLAFPISATISSITQARGHVQSSDDMLSADMGGTSSSSAGVQRSSGANSGLLGGIAGTTAGVVNSTTAAVGTTVSATSAAAGSTAAGLSRSLGRIQISESSSTSVEGGTLLTLQGDNLQLQKGTNFNLVLNQSATVTAGKN